MEEKDPDDVMLNPDYARKLRAEKTAAENDPLDTRLDRPLTEEELAEFGKRRNKTKSGLTISPMLKIKNLGRKGKKPVFAVIIGIEGTF